MLDTQTLTFTATNTAGASAAATITFKTWTCDISRGAASGTFVCMVTTNLLIGSCTFPENTNVDNTYCGSPLTFLIQTSGGLLDVGSLAWASSSGTTAAHVISFDFNG